MVASARGDGADRVWCPVASEVDPSREDYAEKLRHFQWHWVRGHPVMVRDVRGKMNWHHKVLLRAFTDRGCKSEKGRKGAGPGPDADQVVHVTGCWSTGEASAAPQFEMSTKAFFVGFRNADRTAHPDDASLMQGAAFPLMYKLRDYLTEGEFKERAPRLYADFVSVLPFQEYTNPADGPLNLASQLPQTSVLPELGPKTYVGYGRGEELGASDSVTRLHGDRTDGVNVLMHSLDAFSPGSATAGPTPGEGARWHVFRREDALTLTAFLQARRGDLQYASQGDYCRTAPLQHPVHDQVFFLTAADLEMLRRDTGIEPWTVPQEEGTAVFVPAGCAHQVRNLRSCMKVALDFVSPDTAVESCLRTPATLRALPTPREDKLQGEAMAIAAARAAAARLAAFANAPSA